MGVVLAADYKDRVGQYVCVDLMFASHSQTNGYDNRDNSHRWYSTELERFSIPYDRTNQDTGDDTARRFKANYEMSCAKCVVPSTTDREGEIFIRWGSRECPKLSSLVYDGWMAGGGAGGSGSGYQQLCMSYTNDMIMADAGDNAQPTSGRGEGAILSGTEYRSFLSNVGGEYADAACAVCQMQSPANTWTHWAGWVCPSHEKSGGKSEGDTLYSGVAHASRYNHKHPSEHICVDQTRAKTKFNDPNNNNANQIYPVEYRRGNLDDKKYRNGDELLCSVCNAGGCPAGQWKKEFAGTCSKCTPCPKGQYEDPMSPCSTHSDRSCVKCNAAPAKTGYFQTTICSNTNGNGVWAACSSDCGGDQYELLSCTEHHDRQCEPITECTDGEYEMTRPTAKSNRVCAKVSNECGIDAFETHAPTATSDRQCYSKTRGCPTGFYMSDPVGGEVCFPVAVCEHGKTYEVKVPTATSNRDCISVSPQCDLKKGLYEKLSATVLRDRECAVYEPCVLGEEFESSPGVMDPTASYYVKPPVCTAVARCSAEEFVVTEATATTDAACFANCGECPVDTYESTPCSRDSQTKRECRPCTTCPAGTVAIVPCTSQTDRQCEQKSQFPVPRDMDSPAVGSSDGRLTILGESVAVSAPAFGSSARDFIQDTKNVEAELSEALRLLKALESEGNYLLGA